MKESRKILAFSVRSSFWHLRKFSSLFVRETCSEPRTVKSPISRPAHYKYSSKFSSRYPKANHWKNEPFGHLFWFIIVLLCCSVYNGNDYSAHIVTRKQHFRRKWGILYTKWWRCNRLPGLWRGKCLCVDLLSYCLAKQLPEPFPFSANTGEGVLKWKIWGYSLMNS